MQLSWIWLLAGVFVFALGLMIFLGKFPRKKNIVYNNTQKKDGLPILPRHQRNLSATPNIPQETPDTVVQHSPTKPQTTQPSQTSPNDEPTTTPNSAPNSSAPDITQITPKNNRPSSAPASNNSALRNDQILRQSKKTVAISIIPKNDFVGIDGETILKIARQYALKFGTINLFHRYEHANGSGMLWFSVVGITKDQITDFDLERLPKTQYQGLKFFVSLPNPQALKGFDAMVQVTHSIASEIDAILYDDDGNQIDNRILQDLRDTVSNFVE